MRKEIVAQRSLLDQAIELLLKVFKPSKELRKMDSKKGRVGPRQLADTAKETVIICANHALKTAFFKETGRKETGTSINI